MSLQVNFNLAGTDRPRRFARRAQRRTTLGRVVLLVDDPPAPKDPADRTALESMRRLPGELQRLLDAAAGPFMLAREAFQQRAAQGAYRQRFPEEVAALRSMVRAKANNGRPMISAGLASY